MQSISSCLFKQQECRSLIKLWAWTAREGYFRRISYTVKHVSLPPLEKIQKIKFCNSVGSSDLNTINKYSKNFEQELIKLIGMDENTYLRIVEYGERLNVKGCNDNSTSMFPSRN